MPSLHFTEAALRSLPTPEAGKRVRFADTETPGLILRASAGAKVLAYRDHHAEITLGRWPALSVADARAMVRKQIAPDPKAAAQAKRNEREAETLRDAWDALLAHPWRRDGRAPLRPSSMQAYRDSWEHIKVLGPRRLDGITGADVERLRGALLRAHGAAQTRKALALLVVLMGGRMPLGANRRPVGKPRLEPRRRYLDGSELSAFLRGLDGEPQLWRVFWLCCLLAPLRRGNIQAAEWQHLSIDQPGQGRWLVSADAAKGGRLLAVPIAEPLRLILCDWRRNNPDPRWLFPCGLTAGPRAHPGPILSVQHAWKRACLLAEAVRLCDALADQSNANRGERFAQFRRDLASLRETIHATQAGRPRAGVTREQKRTPLEIALGTLRDEAQAAGIAVDQCAFNDAQPHDLRRTAASWAVQAGGSLAVVASVLGHADSRVTEQHYGHLSDDPKRALLTDNASRLLGVLNHAEGNK